MPKVHETLEISAPPERIWEVVRQHERIPEWQVSVLEVKDVTGPLDQPGSGYTVVQRLAGRTIEGRWEVAEAERPRRLVLNGSAPGGGKAILTSTFEGGEGRTQFTVELDYQLPGGFVGSVANKVFAERAVRNQIRHSNENLKALVESEAAAPG